MGIVPAWCLAGVLLAGVHTSLLERAVEGEDWTMAMLTYRVAR